MAVTPPTATICFGPAALATYWTWLLALVSRREARDEPAGVGFTLPDTSEGAYLSRAETANSRKSNQPGTETIPGFFASVGLSSLFPLSVAVE